MTNEYDGRNGNGYQPLPSESKGIAAPPRERVTDAELASHAANNLIVAEQTIAELRAQLAALERQEPVAWTVRGDHGIEADWYVGKGLDTLPLGTKLYAKPVPAERTVANVGEAEQAQEEKREAFRDHLSKCAAEVATWPQWKRESLGRPIATCSRGLFETWVLETEHPVIGWVGVDWLDQGDAPNTYANDYIQGAWVMWGHLNPSLPAAGSAVEEAEIRVVFDGPPGHESGRFVECEDTNGCSINAGEWRQRADGLWELLITAAPQPPVQQESDCHHGVDDGACKECHVAEPAPEQDEREIKGVERYRVESTGKGFWPFCVRAGDGTRELFVGHRKECERVAAELATAFEDGKFAATRPGQTEQQPVAVPVSWWQLIYDSIRNYRLTTLVDADGDGYELIDAMTAEGHPVSGGIEECTYLTDAIWNALLAARPAQKDGDQ